MKGFVFIYGNEIALRFIASGAFKALEKDHDLTYVALRSNSMMPGIGLEDIFASELQKVEWVPFHPDRFGVWANLFDISCILNRKRSSSFDVRCQMRASSPERDRFREQEQYAHPGVYEQMRTIVEQHIGLNPEFLALVTQKKPDFFVLPSALMDFISDDVLQISDKLKIPTLLLVLGWDNLSSKGLLYHKPTMIGVWGEQSKKHAIEVQDIAADRIHVIGAPHFEYFRIRKTQKEIADLRISWGVPATGNLVLFGGTFRPFDETQMLQEIDLAITNGTLPATHLIYRPHPWRDSRKSEDNFLNQTWQNISIDPELSEVYRLSKAGAINVSPLSRQATFRMEHLSELYQAVDAVISPMSTVLLESLFFGNPTMAISFGDGKHLWSPDKVSHMLHFKELYEIPDFIVCREREKLISTINLLLSRTGDRHHSEALSKYSEYFVYQDDYSYGERVSSLVDILLDKTIK
jgi:hypothetical protein